MNKLLTIFALISLSVCLSQVALAQRGQELEQAVETIEELADNLGDNVEEIGETLEGLMEEHADELEAWAEEYSGQWENWANQFEHKFSRWAEDQERVWEQWADQYSAKWEEWAEKIESEEFDPDEMNALIQKNLKMLGDMPLGQMMDGMLKEGTAGLENAPWESLRDLQGMLQESIKKSLSDAEQRLAQSARELERTRKNIEAEIVEQEEDFILPVETELILPAIKNQQEGIQAKQKILANEARQALRKIEQKLSEGDIDSNELKALLQRLIEESGQKQSSGAEARRRVSEELRRAAGAEKLQHAKARIQLEREQRAAEEHAASNAKIVAERRLLETLDRIRETEQSNPANRDALKRIYKALEVDEQKIQSKNEELDALRREIRQLRNEVEKMKSDRKKDR